MIRLLICLLVAMGVEAQPFALPQLGSDDQGPSGPFTPQSPPGLALWWVADDVTNQIAVTKWPDRIQSNYLFTPTNRPLVSTDSVFIDGRTASATFLNVTNLFFNQGSTNSYWLCLKPIYRGSGSQLGTLMSDAAGNNWQELDAATPTTFNWYVHNAAGVLSASILFSNLTTLSWSALKNGSGNGTSYTNGVQSVNNIAHGLTQIDQLGRLTLSTPNQGNDGLFYLYQLAVYTNTTLSAANESNLNWFATNYSGAVLGSVPVFATYIVNENFDSAGTPAGWGSGGTVTFHNTSGALEGTGDVLVGTGTSFANPAQFGPFNEIWGFCLFKVTTLPSSSANFIGFWDYTTGLTMVGGVQLDNLGKISLVVNGSGGAVMTDAITINTLYYCWIHYKTGTGNAVVSCGISTTGTEPTGGTSFVGTTTGTSTSTAGYYVLETQNSAVCHFDHVRVATTDPGNSPP